MTKNDGQHWVQMLDYSTAHPDSFVVTVHKIRNQIEVKHLYRVSMRKCIQTTNEQVHASVSYLASEFIQAGHDMVIKIYPSNRLIH